MNIRSLQNAPGPRRGLTFMLALGAVAGILLWAKLRLVSNMPRSVYADPKQVDGADGGNHARKRVQNAPTPEEVFEASEARTHSQSDGDQSSSESQTGEPSPASTDESNAAEDESSPH
jgi:hypothetical protein